jgi:hypothetical protein
MATIKINEIRFVGSDLFSDSESYLNELSNADTLEITGGIFPIGISILAGSAASAALRFSSAISNAVGSNLRR